MTVTKNMQQIYNKYFNRINAICSSVRECGYAKFVIGSSLFSLAGDLTEFFETSQLFDVKINYSPEFGYKFLITQPGLLQKFSEEYDDDVY